MAKGIQDALKEHHRAIEFCTFCPKMCRFACPVANVTANETYTPWGRQTLLHMVSEGHIEFNREIAYTVYQCASCLACQAACDHLIDVPAVMTTAREQAVAMDLEPHEVGEYRQFFSQHNNPYGVDLRARVRSRVPEAYLERDAQVAYFAGCAQAYHHPQDLQDTVKVFEAMDLDYVAVFEGEAMCCGAPLRQLGLRDDYERNAKKLAAELSKYKTIVSGSPTCVHELKVQYAQMGLNMTPRIFHTTEFLWPLIREGKLRHTRPFGQSVMYHDPCTLARYLDVVEEPRNILKEVLREPLLEFGDRGKNTGCCGSGGSLAVTNPEAASDIAKERLRDFHDSEAKVLVTACPNCRNQLATADPDIEVLDIINVLARCV